MDVLIVDDEPLARERLTRMINALGGFRIVAHAGSGQSAIRAAKETSPDIVFMDVRMPGMDGLAAAQHLAELDPPPAVIFSTAHGDYAVEAFSSRAVGYLLKPIRREDLEGALNRAKRVNKAQLAELQQSSGMLAGARAHIAAKNRRGINLVPASDVRLFQADHKYVTAYYPDGEALLDETLKELEDEFEGRFVRVHRNALVAINHIIGIERDTDGQCFVRLNGLDIKPQVSRRHVADLRRLVQQL